MPRAKESPADRCAGRGALGALHYTERRGLFPVLFVGFRRFVKVDEKRGYLGAVLSSLGSFSQENRGTSSAGVTGAGSGMSPARWASRPTSSGAVY